LVRQFVIERFSWPKLGFSRGRDWDQATDSVFTVPRQVIAIFPDNRVDKIQAQRGHEYFPLLVAACPEQ
jgi:hypothetical protein